MVEQWLEINKSAINYLSVYTGSMADETYLGEGIVCLRSSLTRLLTKGVEDLW